MPGEDANDRVFSDVGLCDQTDSLSVTIKSEVKVKIFHMHSNAAN